MLATNHRWKYSTLMCVLGAPQLVTHSPWWRFDPWEPVSLFIYHFYQVEVWGKRKTPPCCSPAASIKMFCSNEAVTAKGQKRLPLPSQPIMNTQEQRGGRGAVSTFPSMEKISIKPPPNTHTHTFCIYHWSSAHSGRDGWTGLIKIVIRWAKLPTLQLSRNEARLSAVPPPSGRVGGPRDVWFPGRGLNRCTNSISALLARWIKVLSLIWDW